MPAIIHFQEEVVAKLKVPLRRGKAAAPNEMVRHPALLLVATLCTGMGGLATPTNTVGTDPFPETSGDTKQRASGPAIKAEFARYICGSVPECGIKDISDQALDYGVWLAARLGVEQLARLPVISAFYVEAGPRRDGSSLSLGLVSYRSTAATQTRAILTALRQIPEGAFKDGMVIMRFKPRLEGNRIDLFFTDSFDRALDHFFEIL